MSVVSKALRDPKTYAGLFIAATFIARYRASMQKQDKEQKLGRTNSFEALLKAKKKKVAVDRVFLQRLKALLKVLIPGIKTKEMLTLLLHTGFLVARTFTSIYVAKLDGSIVKAIVDGDARAFSIRMLKWILLAIPATYINSMIRFLESKLALAFRTRLVTRLYDKYMENETYYRVSNMDSRIANPDQGLTTDVANFCSQLAHIYSQLSKPVLDIILMSAQIYLLSKKRSGQAHISHAVFIISVVISTAGLLKVCTPPFGKLVAEEARRYGILRATHARLITHSEEIAFYGGDKIEKSSIAAAYSSLVHHMNRIFNQRIPYIMLEQFLMKYVWGAAGLIMIAIPDLKVGGSKMAKPANTSQRTQDFVTSRGLLVSAADACERIMSSWKEIAELAGLTARVAEMMNVFDDVAHGVYKKPNLPEDAQRVLQQAGIVYDEQPFISLDRVPIVTPNGDALVKELTFRIAPGEHLLITGPNGCGKSSFFRMLGGLWPTYGGVLHKPARHDMFYIPQRPYLSAGCLRDQFIYPDNTQDMRDKNRKDEELFEVLEIVDLAYIVERSNGWDAHNDWREVLSGGEKQRVAMARLFYHKPAFAILDECTSAVSIDVEGQMYQYAKDIGITLLTVTHRPSLWKYHEKLLQFDGQGSYEFTNLDADKRLSLSEEKKRIEQQLAGMPQLSERLGELCSLLGEDNLIITPTTNMSPPHPDVPFENS